jgi:hypothetical protein
MFQAGSPIIRTFKRILYTQLTVLPSRVIFGALAKLRKATINVVICACTSVSPSYCPSVCLSAWNISAPIGQIFMKF